MPRRLLSLLVAVGLSLPIAGGARAAVVLNAAGALYVAGKGDTLPEAMALAEESLDSGAGLAKLEQLREATNTVA